MYYIAVIDCNNFFVSCERLFRPDLAQRPVIVQSSNDGCVIARSSEVKDMAVPMGIPIFQIKDIIKDNDITLFSSNFALYRDISRRVHSVIADLFATSQPYSIDESFVRFAAESDSEAHHRLVTAKRQIEQLVGIPVSIGAGRTKTQAKYASTKAKREIDGVLVTNEDWWKRHAADIPLRDIWGVGRRLAERYTTAGIHTVADLRTAPAVRLRALGGVVALRQQAELQGVVADPVSRLREQPKSITSTRSFGHKTDNVTAICEAVQYHLETVCRQARQQGLLASVVTVLVRPARDYWSTRPTSVTFAVTPTADAAALREQARQELLHLLESDVLYQKAGVILSGLVPASNQQPELFPSDVSATDAARTALATMVHNLEAQFGVGRIGFGLSTQQPVWHTKAERLSPAWTTKWTDIPTVRS